MAKTVSISKTSSKRGAHFRQAEKGTAVRVSPGKGGVSTGLGTHCTSSRKHFQVGYGKGQ